METSLAACGRREDGLRRASGSDQGPCWLLLQLWAQPLRLEAWRPSISFGSYVICWQQLRVRRVARRDARPDSGAASVRLRDVGSQPRRPAARVVPLLAFMASLSLGVGR
jgi:hypothetical protein